jgi:hypothetical protein
MDVFLKRKEKKKLSRESERYNNIRTERGKNTGTSSNNKNRRWLKEGRGGGMNDGSCHPSRDESRPAKRQEGTNIFFVLLLLLLFLFSPGDVRTRKFPILTQSRSLL